MCVTGNSLVSTAQKWYHQCFGAGPWDRGSSCEFWSHSAKFMCPHIFYITKEWHGLPPKKNTRKLHDKHIQTWRIWGFPKMADLPKPPGRIWGTAQETLQETASLGQPHSEMLRPFCSRETRISVIDVPHFGDILGKPNARNLQLSGRFKGLPAIYTSCLIGNMDTR